MPIAHSGPLNVPEGGHILRFPFTNVAEIILLCGGPVGVGWEGRDTCWPPSLSERPLNPILVAENLAGYGEKKGLC